MAYSQPRAPVGYSLLVSNLLFRSCTPHKTISVLFSVTRNIYGHVKLPYLFLIRHDVTR